MDGSMEKRKLGPIQLDSYQPLREVVCETLRDAVRRGILQPGERLMEIQLAEDLGVSRTPVREAIRKLAIFPFATSMKCLKYVRLWNPWQADWQLSVLMKTNWKNFSGFL